MNKQNYLSTEKYPSSNSINFFLILKIKVILCVEIKFNSKKRINNLISVTLTTYMFKTV